MAMIILETSISKLIPFELLIKLFNPVAGRDH